MTVFLLILLIISFIIILALIISVRKLFNLNDTYIEDNDGLKLEIKTLSQKLSDIKLYVFEAYMNMRAVDTLGAFEADDDAGYMFDAIKKIIIDLGMYSVEEIRVLHDNPELTDPRAKQFVNDLYEKLKQKQSTKPTTPTEEIVNAE